MYRLLATSTAALIAAATPVLAEVTPAQVWDNLSKYYTDMGYQVTTGGREEAGDTLTLTDVAITVDGQTSDATMSLPKMVLQQTGDARVRSVIEGDIVTDMTADVPDQDPAEIRFIISMPGNEMLSSGSPQEMLHEVTYPQMLLAARFGQGAQDGGIEGAPVQVTLTDVKASQQHTAGDATQTTYGMSAARLDLAVDVAEMPTEGSEAANGTLKANGTVDGLSMSGTMTAPDGQFDMAENPHAALNAGMEIDGTFTAGAVTGTAEFTGTDAEGMAQSANTTFASGDSELTIAMSRDGLSYGGNVDGTSVEMSISDLPFPISYAIENASAMLTLPISKSDQPQPYRLAYSLAGLTLADGIWNLFDPGQQLPRDPASLTVDLEGQAVVSDDLLDPAMAQRMEPEAPIDPASGAPAMPPMPFRAETVKFNQFTLDAVGAKADVTGDLTIPEGAGQPVGTLSGSFTGVNALLDTLVSMGLVPQEQIMGARMMIAMFARPSEGNPGQLQTQLEFRQDGSIFANGQQVK